MTLNVTINGIIFAYISINSAQALKEGGIKNNYKNLPREFFENCSQKSIHLNK